ncbi:MAG TPA: alkaline phosphatase family protein, partial [Bacteroidia bacterium]|nr:alkaline phosphatase family protein [Bacteroidia bacterium]
NLESIHKIDGNLMPNLLNGSEAISSDILSGMDPLPAPVLSQPLQNFGTLFKEFRYKEGPTGHYNGHTCAVTGKYTSTDLNIKDHPQYPTIFEYYRKHNSPSNSPMNAWWISNQLGPYPALNYSKYPGYGSAFGANFMAPTSLISIDGYDALGNMKSYSSNEEAAITKIKSFLNNNFNKTYTEGDAGIVNTESDQALLKNYITDSFNKALAGQFNNPWGAGASMNNDMYNVFFAEELIKEFKPELLVVNMQDVDICHNNFTQYANNLRKADYAVAHLWNTIQNTPGMANDTVLIVAPEHGRNQATNNSIDPFGRYAIDHTASVDLSGDQMAREIFCLVAGPPSVVNQNLVINQTAGESIEIIPTIANILGFDTSLPTGILKPYSSCDMQQAFI